MVEVLNAHYDEMDNWFQSLSFSERITILSKYDVEDWYELDGDTKEYIYDEEGG